MTLKQVTLSVLSLLVATMAIAQGYQPTPENIAARQRMANHRFGIFLHWGIYSTYAQGEWYLNSGINKDEYAKAASAFYPHRFNADAWVKAIKASGAKYITFTSRHHDSFSMFKTNESSYNIVDATPYGRDVMKELSAACEREDIDFHLYYSILDWIREDYPVGRTGLKTGRTYRPNYETYFKFMKNQVRELLTNYGDVKAIWLDGYWDHDSDSIPFDWRMPEFYRYIHALKPACLVGNNHHIYPLEGEDFQMFERDLPGENRAGLSGQDISKLPLEMCQTMNGMWGYKVSDINYKSWTELVQTIVRAAAKGSNLLLNIGPQPNGELPLQALERLQKIGEWMKVNGETIYGTERGRIAEQNDIISTDKGNITYLHILAQPTDSVKVVLDKKPRKVLAFKNKQSLRYTYDKKLHTLSLQLPEGADTSVDYIIEIVR
ncbi:alpha-L-fucosidase [Prevotella ihumii]|uniref:alpha-L-fucosidase n=1 Tax=Prevotella ihumii TaxID=1917878 RepID=UPI0009816802|nr:alpha-L-fucosidase [Prevotella ihumii]